mmetsp:Transcript_40213/g.89235  ORF Transcript_40213/g.89235 Transcript_40213/m.89235 type:complete len:620 (+) Transcript_40213:318-2177(+)|eukprot:CAMPEP_0202906230 /NCGR_PEP_ID=MMETSP1392-20130828/37874_1 /ASSEMBLY_ACC=CAM_ASM_000868 /TAXON_ID=225041 /ORGANISM="Chlamydomonas chlamydogama, Strain SAG 11-48b" /LENGTH=619 /DNA_ID=CAMNT_0049594631 /DNA_START=243 /DNA_END=2102 /DNA_ORIENTATION=-
MEHSQPSSTEGSVAAPEATQANAAVDVARQVFSHAPFWVYSSSWHCRHPDATNETSFIQFSGPHSSAEVYQLYKNRQMKGSNLVVGLVTDKVQGKDVPASFFRTLAYVFEVAKSGRTYAAVTEADVARGTPDHDWCSPLWQNPGSTGGSSTGSSSGGISEGVSSASVTPSASSAFESAASCGAAAQALTEAASSRLFSSAPFWCYLYSHEPVRAKKTPPKTAEQMLDMHKHGCLPEWTPVLGLEEDVSTFNSLPPSLFMTLGSLLHLASMGSVCKAVGMQELTRWDKFIDSRTPTGSTQGVVQVPPAPAALPHHPAAAGTTNGTMHPSHVMPHVPPGAMSPHHAGANGSSMQQGMFYPPGAAPAGYMPYQAHGYPAPYMTPMMWYGRYTPMYPASNGAAYPRSPASAPYSPASSKGGRSGSQRPEQTPANAAGAKPGKQAGNGSRRKAAEPARYNEQPMMYPMPHQWETAIFRLFTVDATRGPTQAAWWYLTASDKSRSTVVGPLSCEKMILAYARGNLTNKHLVCATTSDVPPNMPPPREYFEKIGSLLHQVEQGGQYMLVTLQEMCGDNPEAAAAAMAAHHAAMWANGSGMMYHPEVHMGAAPIEAPPEVLAPVKAE